MYTYMYVILCLSSLCLSVFPVLLIALALGKTERNHPGSAFCFCILRLNSVFCLIKTQDVLCIICVTRNCN